MRNQKLLWHGFPLATGAQNVKHAFLAPTGQKLGDGLAFSLALKVIAAVLLFGPGIVRHTPNAQRRFASLVCVCVHVTIIPRNGLSG